MQKLTSEKILLTIGSLFAIGCSFGRAQALPEPTHNSVSVALTYHQMQANAVGGDAFWMQGGSLQLADRPWRTLDIVADVAGLHTGATHNPNVGLDLITMTFGPRYCWAPVGRRFSAYGEVLAGEAFGMNSLFPSANGATSGAHSLTLQLGGGANVPLSPHISIRAFEADWVRTQMPNATTSVQNSLRIGAGVIFRFR
jgi:hypothetical protein